MPISTTAQSSESKRQLDNRVPSHLPVKLKIKKENEEGFQNVKNEHWISDFELEVKNTGDRPIYGLSVVWLLEEVTMPDGNYYALHSHSFRVSSILTIFQSRDHRASYLS